jgi:hypothetical protein
MRKTDNRVEVLFLPQANFPPKVVGIVNDLLEQLNRRLLSMPDQSGRIIRFGLLQNGAIEFEVKTNNDTTEVQCLLNVS